MTEKCLLMASKSSDLFLIIFFFRRARNNGFWFLLNYHHQLLNFWSFIHKKCVGSRISLKCSRSFRSPYFYKSWLRTAIIQPLSPHYSEPIIFYGPSTNILRALTMKFSTHWSGVIICNDAGVFLNASWISRYTKKVICYDRIT